MSAHRTRVSFFTVFELGRFFRYYAVIVGMVERLNVLLRYDNRTANRAVLAFCLPLLIASRFYRFVYNFGMPLCCYYVLFYQYGITYGTMLTFRKPRFRTSGFYRIVYYFRMTFCRYVFYILSSAYCTNSLS